MSANASHPISDQLHSWMVAARNQKPQKPHQKVWLEQTLAQSRKGEILVGDNSHKSLVTDKVQAAKLLALLGLGLLSPVPLHPLLLDFLLLGFTSISV